MMLQDDARGAWEEVYRSHYAKLCRIAVAKFSVPPSDAESLVHDVLIAYVQHAATVREIGSWLVAATCNASRNYWRLRQRNEPLPEDVATIADLSQSSTHIEDRLEIARALSRVSEKYREALRLRYIEGCSLAEVAAELGTSAGYAEKLVRLGVARVKEAIQ
jgi:RNA polymerase sigma factor (sigma-70 family)